MVEASIVSAYSSRCPSSSVAMASSPNSSPGSMMASTACLPSCVLWKIFTRPDDQEQDTVPLVGRDINERAALERAGLGAAFEPANMLVREALEETAVLQVPELFIHPDRPERRDGDVLSQNNQPLLGSQEGTRRPGGAPRRGSTDRPKTRAREADDQNRANGRSGSRSRHVDSLTGRDVEPMRRRSP